MDLSGYVRNVPDFPKPGIGFKDITPLLRDAAAFSHAIDQLAAPFVDSNISHVVAIESRGFIFGGAVATKLGAGFVPIRKPGKLPWTTHRHEYHLEYGTDAVEIHDDALTADCSVLIVDDVLATGGTATAAASLVKLFGAHTAGFAFVIELDFLNGREKLGSIPVHSLIHY